MINVEKLIEQLEAWNEQHLSVVCGNGHFACDYLCENEDCIVVRAADALEKLQAENEKLRAELEQVKRENDALWIYIEIVDREYQRYMDRGYIDRLDELKRTWRRGQKED